MLPVFGRPGFLAGVLGWGAGAVTVTVEVGVIGSAGSSAEEVVAGAGEVVADAGGVVADAGGVVADAGGVVADAGGVVAGAGGVVAGAGGVVAGAGGVFAHLKEAVPLTATSVLEPMMMV